MKEILIFIFIFFNISFYANNEDSTKSILLSKLKTNSEDSLQKLDSIRFIHFWDSVKTYPAYDIYQEWDNIHVHFKGFDATKMCDTVNINLSYDSCDYMHPYCGVVTSDFGYRWGRYHYGIDVDLNTGDHVYPAFSGVVRIAQWSSGYGKLVVIRHSNGLETYYGHLSKIKVKEGDKVETDDIIALGGNTGKSTGSHLHFEVRYLGNAIDPKKVIDFDKGQLLSNTLKLNKKEHFQYLVELRKRKYHRVRSGDSLSKIGSRYGVSIKKLCSLNGISRSSILRIGQKIRYN